MGGVGSDRETASNDGLMKSPFYAFVLIAAEVGRAIKQHHVTGTLSFPVSKPCAAMEHWNESAVLLKALLFSFRHGLCLTFLHFREFHAPATISGYKIK